MRIGYDAKRLFGNFTGLGNYSRTLVQDVARFHPEHEYHLYTPAIRQHPAIQPFLEDAQYTTFVPSSSFRSLWRSYGVVKQLTRGHIELYHGLSHELPVGLARAGIPGVVTMHDVISKVYPQWYGAVERFIYDQKVRYSCHHATQIIAISEHTKRDLVEHYRVDPAKIKVIYQACDPIYYQQQPPEQVASTIAQLGITTPYLLGVGSLEPRKNIATLLRAYQHLPTDLRVPLVLVGKGKRHKQQLQHLLAQANLEDVVHWLENLVDIQQLQALYQGASALIYPSLYEGFGLPIAEALLCKTPVITSSTSALPEAGGPTSCYIDPTSPKQLAHAIEKVLTDPAYADHMREQGYQYAQTRFSPARLATQLITCYEQQVHS
ncbi:glycosyltransferase family 4 protein [Hymenobacter aerilatus]|uniref:Glycosyltransferase family 4 protein n=1 Tax=Hymenobacter aerilatus TaxID=2932251 RepID=A0A8T9SYN0_9BACT|nr:glycosyltransferase family 1 protein [Hymenobacter aerilatus]UOR06004.1 glycosyltransferase family 4 protein [Hymenobacter aerilatus]